ncbi:MAG: iron-containing alcohol dehydrogenase [Actinomycetota bacterium]|nr:iron-containing alcohol dehydrogenase [Actinomycetota bacterium]
MLDHASGPVPPIATGPASLLRLHDLGASWSCRQAVLVVDAAVVTSGYVERVTDHLDGIDATVHVLGPGEPTAGAVDAAAHVVRAADRAVVIGVGGGSALDTAKQAAAAARGDEGIEHYALGAAPWPGDTATPKRHRIVAIPTTAGTGAEVTRTCIVTDRSGRKVWTWGDELLPDLVLLDPVATVTMPPAVTTASGLDAFVHALESCSGRRTAPLVAAPALHAARLVVDHLPTAVHNGTDLDARQAMQEAALLAGLAIDGGGTGIAHSIGHALGTLAHVPHGVAVAVGLAASLRWSVAGERRAYAAIASAIGCGVAELPARYDELTGAAQLAHAVARVGVLDVPAETLAATMVAEENRPMWENSSRRADDADRLLLAEATLERWHELCRVAA